MRPMREAFALDKKPRYTGEPRTLAEAYVALVYVEHPERDNDGALEMHLYMKRGGDGPIMTNTVFFSGPPGDRRGVSAETLTRLGHELTRSVVEIMRPQEDR